MVPYIVQGLLEEIPSVLQGGFVQVDAAVGLVIQEAGEGHPVVRHVALHRKEAQDELPVRLLQGSRAVSFSIHTITSQLPVAPHSPCIQKT